MTSIRSLWHILNGKLDSILRGIEGQGARLDRAIGEASAARAESAALRARIAALEASVRDEIVASEQRVQEVLAAILTDVQGGRREHSSFSEALSGLQVAQGEALKRLDHELPAQFRQLAYLVQHSETHRIVPLIGTVDRMQRAVGRIEGRQVDSLPLDRSEFQVFSQGGEDGLLWRLAALVPESRRRFVEFGVEDFAEANSRFLLTDGGWTGLILDGGEANISRIRESLLYWQYSLKAVQAFVTRENINALLTDNGVYGEIGYLSVDIDGNDYWVWEAITGVDPIVVSVEFNWRFGPDRSVTVPYDPGFVRQMAHPSWLYFGASLAALEKLGKKKGYALVGIGSSAVNAFFVKQEHLTPEIPPRLARELWRAGRFSEFHDEAGAMVKLSEEEQAKLVLSLPLIEID